MFIRFNKETGLLTGWGDTKAELPLRKGESAAELTVKPSGDDYEAYLYSENQIVSNPSFVVPAPSRDLAKEIDDLKSEMKKLKSPL